MKYIKTFESTDDRKFTCSIDIRNIEPKKVSLICKKLMYWFPNFRFNSDVELVADTDPKYLKLNTKDYGYIEVSKLYVYLEIEKHHVYNSRIPLIDPQLVFISETVDELIQNVEIFKTSTKYNL